MGKPLGSSKRYGHVSLGGELRLVEGKNGRSGDSGGKGRKRGGGGVVPLHGDEGERRVGCGVGRPVVEPGDLGAGLGEDVDGVGVVDGPAEAAF